MGFVTRALARPTGARAWALGAVLVVAACHDEPVQPVQSFELDGSYHGTVQASTDIASLDAALGLSIATDGGIVTGSYTLSGRLVYLGAVADIDGDGEFTGTVGSEDEPLIDIVVRTPLCAGYEAPFTGRFVPSTGRLFLGGAVDIFEGYCTILVSFDVVMTLFQEMSPDA